MAISLPEKATVLPLYGLKPRLKIETKQRKQLKKLLKPRPKIGPISISGHVTVPDGRELGGINLNP